MKDLICTILQILFLVGMIAGWVFIHFAGSDFIFLAAGLIGVYVTELARE